MGGIPVLGTLARWVVTAFIVVVLILVLSQPGMAHLVWGGFWSAAHNVAHGIGKAVNGG